MRILFPALFFSLLFTPPASAQSSIAGASGAAPAAAASAEAPPAAIKPVKPIRSEAPIATAKSKTIEMAVGYTYLSQPGSQSNRLGLRGADASFTIGYSRLGLKVDLGYARASNFEGTGRHTDVLTYMAGPVFHPTMHRNFATFIHALGGAARVSGPVPLTGGFSGDGRRTSPGWQAAELITR